MSDLQAIWELHDLRPVLAEGREEITARVVERRQEIGLWVRFSPPEQRLLMNE